MAKLPTTPVRFTAPQSTTPRHCTGTVFHTRITSLFSRLFTLRQTPEERSSSEFADRQLEKHLAYMRRERQVSVPNVRMRDKRDGLIMMGGAA